VLLLPGFCSTVRGAKRGEDLVLDAGDIDWILDEPPDPMLSPFGRRCVGAPPGEDV
jgi:hypothetical protein